MVDSRRTDALDADKADAVPPISMRSKWICASCGVIQAVQRRMAWVLTIAAVLTAVLTFVAIEWAEMG